MQISENGLNLIKKFEGCRLTAYHDIGGKLTIGYGHTAGVYEGQVISQEVADTLLKNEMVSYSNDVQALIDNHTIIFDVNQNMFDALTSFCYNLGKGNLAALCKGRDKEQVSSHMCLYVNVNHKICQGLLNRRNAERELFLRVTENFQSYTVVSGDTLGKLAKRFHTTIKYLAQKNCIKDVNKIYVGQVIKY